MLLLSLSHVYVFKEVVYLICRSFVFPKEDLELLLDRVNDLIEFRINAILEEMSSLPLCQLPQEDPLTCEEFLQMTKVIRKLIFLTKLFFLK